MMFIQFRQQDGVLNGFAVKYNTGTEYILLKGTMLNLQIPKLEQINIVKWRELSFYQLL